MKRSKTVGDLAGLGEYERRKQLWARRRAQGGSLAVLPADSASAHSRQALVALAAAPNPTLLNSARRPLPFAAAPGAVAMGGLRRPLLVPVEPAHGHSSCSSGLGGGERSPPLFPGAPPALRPSTSDPPPYLLHSPRASPPLSASSGQISAVFSTLRIASASASASSESLATMSTSGSGRYGLTDTEGEASSTASSAASASSASLAGLSHHYHSAQSLTAGTGTTRMGTKRKSEQELPDIDVLLRDGEEEEEGLLGQDWSRRLEEAASSPGWCHIVDPEVSPPPPALHESEEDGYDDEEEEEEEEGEEGTNDEGGRKRGGWAGCPSPPRPPRTPTLGLDAVCIPAGSKEEQERAAMAAAAAAGMVIGWAKSALPSLGGRYGGGGGMMKSQAQAAAGQQGVLSDC